MIRRATSEIKIIGINFFIISVAFTSALIVLSVIAGDHNGNSYLKADESIIQKIANKLDIPKVIT